MLGVSRVCFLSSKYLKHSNSCKTLIDLSVKMSTTAKGNGKAPLLNMDTLNPNIKNVEYAVRGPIVIRASEIEKELREVSIGLTILPRTC